MYTTTAAPNRGSSVTSAVRLARLPTKPKDYGAQNALNTPNTIYMPKAAPVRLTNRTTLITQLLYRYSKIRNRLQLCTLND
jgi:hypothetical protein